jgi:hypothetical protein
MSLALENIKAKILNFLLQNCQTSNKIKNLKTTL